MLLTVKCDENLYKCKKPQTSIRDLIKFEMSTVSCILICSVPVGKLIVPCSILEKMFLLFVEKNIM